MAELRPAHLVSHRGRHKEDVRKTHAASSGNWYSTCMVKTLERAMEELASLPEADQEQIGRRLLSHVDKLRQLRADVDKSLRSLDAGEGKPLDVEEFIRQSNASHARS